MDCPVEEACGNVPSVANGVSVKLAVILVLSALAGFSQGRLDGIDASTAIIYLARTDITTPILIDKEHRFTPRKPTQPVTRKK